MKQRKAQSLKVCDTITIGTPEKALYKTELFAELFTEPDEMRLKRHSCEDHIKAVILWCFFKQYTVRSSVVYVFFHISNIFKFYSVTRFVSRFARPNWVKSRRHRSSWYKFVMPLPVVDFEASELRSFVSLHDRCSSTAACCAVAPCFVDPVLGRKKVKRWNMPRKMILGIKS